MARIDSMWFWGVVLQVNFRQLTLLFAQDLELVLEVVLRRLIDNEIQFQVSYLLCWHLAHIIGQIKGRTTPAVAFRTTGLDWQIPVCINTSQGIEVATMNMPDENF